MEKLNGDLHQPSRIRYELRSFSVGYMVSLAYSKWFISRVKLCVVVPQAIGIYLCNIDLSLFLLERKSASLQIMFTNCWGSNLSIQARVGKLNRDLHQPSGIRYESRSFSVIYLVSLAYRKGLIFGFKLSVMVPQAIGISLRNTCNKILDLHIFP